MKRALALLAAALGASASMHAAAQAWPSKPVRILVGNPAGGPADIITRSIGDALSQAIGQPVVVDNRPGGGAGGALAMNLVAQAPADGYTIGMGTSGPLGAGAVLNKLPYDVMKSFTHVSMVSEGAFLLMASSSLKVNSVAELVKHVKSNPGKLNYGSDGIGSSTHLGMELFKLKAGGLFIVHIPYNGAEGRTRGMLSGDTQFMLTSPTAAVDGLVKEGRMRAMFATYDRRLPEYPDLPSAKEVGLPDMVVTSWFGIIAPAGLPADLTGRLNKEIAAALAKPDVRDRIIKAGQPIVRSSTPEEFAAYVAQANRNWREVVARANIKIE